jgi:RNA recognition motif-containing protein
MDIFVGSLPFKLNENELREIFERFGEVVSVKIVINKATRQNKGYGFVSMQNGGEALKAIQELNGSEILGRKIIVSEAQDDKNTQEAKTSSRDTRTWQKKKKQTPSVVTYGDHGIAKSKKFRAGEKKAKNFKVGARKKK